MTKYRILYILWATITGLIFVSFVGGTLINFLGLENDLEILNSWLLFIFFATVVTVVPALFSLLGIVYFIYRYIKEKIAH
jgi:hypothetical protein